MTRVERRCATCTYPLQGLASNGTCPECGAPYVDCAAAGSRDRPRFGWFLLAAPTLSALALWLVLLLDWFLVGGLIMIFVVTPACLLWSWIAAGALAQWRCARRVAVSGESLTAAGYDRAVDHMRLALFLPQLVLLVLAFPFFKLAFQWFETTTGARPWHWFLS